MGRPRKDQTGVSARDRLAQAFWELLEEQSFSDITIGQLSRRAGVNHNTFYYHFNNTEDMARTLFMENLEPQLLLSITPFEPHVKEKPGYSFHELVAGDAPDELIERFHKMRVFARDQSPFMQRLLKEQMLETWLSMSGRAHESLTRQECLSLIFVLGGITALASQLQTGDMRYEMETFAAGSLGSFIFDWLTDFVNQVDAD